MNRLLAELALLGVTALLLHAWLGSRDDLASLKASITQQVEDAARQQKETDDVVIKGNAKTISDFTAAAGDSDRRAATLARRLSSALGRTCPTAQNPDQPAAAAPGGEPEAAAEARKLITAFADYDAACVRDAARLDALNEELKPQL